MHLVGLLEKTVVLRWNSRMPAESPANSQKVDLLE
jgi:hypothetical protein